VKPDTAAHVALRTQLSELISESGLSEVRAGIEALVKPAIGLRTRAATDEDRVVGATRVGGEPDLPSSLAWPVGKEGPLLFVMQVALADVTALDLESLLPSDGQLLLFSDRFVDEPRVLYLPPQALVRRAASESFTECGVDIVAELHLPQDFSDFVGSARDGQPPAQLRLSDVDYDAYCEKLRQPWHARMRPGCSGQDAVHQLLGYTTCQDSTQQRAGDDVLFAFDTDDQAGMEWGDAQCVFTLLPRQALLERTFTPLRAVI